MSRPYFPETDLATAMFKQARGEGFDCEGEICVVIDGQLVSIDGVGCMGEPEGDIWLGIEAKQYLDQTLIGQCLRLRGIAHRIIAVVREPQMQNARHQGAVHVLRGSGIGLAYVDDARLAKVVLKPKHNANAKPALLERAWADRKRTGLVVHETGSLIVNEQDVPVADACPCDEIARPRLPITEAIRQTSTAPPMATILPTSAKRSVPAHHQAGSRGGPAEKRARSRWDAATEWLQGLMGPGAVPQWCKWMEIRRGCGMMNVTPAAARKAYQLNQWTGVEMKNFGGVAHFRAKVDS